MTFPTIDGGRLLARLDAFAAIGGTPAGGVNRPALGVEDRAARALLARLGAARGFSVFPVSWRIDDLPFPKNGTAYYRTLQEPWMFGNKPSAWVHVVPLKARRRLL